jgi:hypothetical protein
MSEPIVDKKLTVLRDSTLTTEKQVTLTGGNSAVIKVSIASS